MHAFNLTILNKVSFLPKLQDHFAEFLRFYYFIRFSILYLTTGVGYKYGFIIFIVFSRIINLFYFKTLKNIIYLKFSLYVKFYNIK